MSRIEPLECAVSGAKDDVRTEVGNSFFPEVVLFVTPVGAIKH